MNIKARFVLVFTLALLAGAALWATLTQAAPGAVPLAQGGAPAAVSYQGEVRVGGAPYTGNGYFKFAVVNAAGNIAYWSNDGTGTGGGEPTAAVQLPVSDGLFSVLLGDTTLGGMTQALTADVFSQPDRYLRVWFGTGVGGPSQLTPDTRIAAVPYALQAQEAADADTVDGLHASQLGADYQNVVVVAKSGGDYTSVQAAIDSISDAAADNPYLVWVAPGVYSETVTMKPYVHLQGAGQEAIIITSTVSSVWPPTEATLVLASDASLRDLMVGNGGAGNTNAALLATAGMTRTLVADVTARALGGGVNNFAIFLSGSGTGITLQQVTALAENGSGLNSGLINFSGAAATLRDGSFTARGGTNAWGIFLLTGTLEAHNVTALGENGGNLNKGLYNYNNSAAVLYGGDYTGRGGNQTGGAGASRNSTLTAYNVTALAENGSGDIGNFAMGGFDNSTMTLHGGVFIARGGVNNYALSNELTVTMKAENVTALAENGSGENYGFWNVNNATAVIHGASFTGRGGTEAYGVNNRGAGTTLEAESVTALGEDGSDGNFGLDNGAVATLRGGSFTGRGGTVDTSGIHNAGSGTTLEADNVTALAEDCSSNNFGLTNYISATATLRGGSFTGRGGTGALGIANADSGTTLEAENITALAENGSSTNYGLLNHSSAEATLRGGAFTARGGVNAEGIHNDSTLEAESISALAENGSDSNHGLYNEGGAARADSSQFTGSSNGLHLESGTVRLGVSQLDGDATNSGGTLICFQVYDSDYVAYTCP